MNTTFLSNVTNMDTSTAPSAVSYGASWQTLVNTGISIFGVMTNLVCFAVFMSPTLKDRTYTCMMVHTLVDLLYLLIQAAMIFLSCGSDCAGRSSTMLGRAYFLYLIFYLSSTLTYFNIFIVIYVTILRCLLILNKNFLSRIPCKYILTCLLLVIMFLDSDILFARYIVKYTLPDGSVAYTYGSTEFSRTRAYEVISQLNKIVRIVLVIGILPAINFLLAFLFKRHFDKKKHLIMASRVSTNRVSQVAESESHSANKSKSLSSVQHSTRKNQETKQTRQASRRITLMVISISLMYSFGNVPYSAVILASNFDRTKMNRLLHDISICLLFLSHGCSLFIFYSTNINFRNIINNFVKKIYNKIF